MGTLFSSLDIARSGFWVAQAQLDVAAHNVANVNKEGFSRQRVNLVTRMPIIRPYGQLGRGVTVANIERLRDIFLDRVYREQVAGLGQAEIQQQFYARIEDVFLEPGEDGFGAHINSFFDALSDFAGNVEQVSVRQSVLSEAEAAASSLNTVAERLYELRTYANEEVQGYVADINSLAERIAELNVSIRQSELNGTQANDLRDDRDVLLDELSTIVNINYREREDGQIDVLVVGEVLINGDEARALEAVRNAALDPERNDLVEVRFVDNGNLLEVRDGELMGALHIRDTALVEIDDRMDDIAEAIVLNLNNIHNQGNGIENLSGLIASTNPTVDAVTPLTGAGLPFPVTVPGSFDVVVYDAAGNPTVNTINVVAGETLTTLAAKLNAVANFSASVVGGNTLSLGTAGAFTFSFQNDATGVLTALGVNGMFTGYDARTIAVNQDLVDNPGWLTSSYSTDVLNTGDNAAALDMAALRNSMILDSNSATVNDYYESSIVLVGTDARSNAQMLEVERAFVEDFQGRRLEVSSVSLDEEITFMIQFQRAFEASARVVTTTDRMLETLLNIVQ